MLSSEMKNALQITRLNLYLEAHEIEMLMQYCSIRNYSAGEIILHQGKKSPGLYIIIEGSALVTARVLGEGITNILTLKQGDFFGEISVIEDGPCPTNVKAITDMHCLLIKKDYFDMLSLSFPKIKYELIRAISDEAYTRFKDIYEKIIQVMHDSHIIPQSLFGSVIKSLTKPSEIKYEEAEINKKLLKCQYPFETFSEKEFEEILQKSVILKAPNQCILIHEGEKEASCYILLRGAVQSSIIYDNKVAKLSVIGPMTLFSGITILDKNSPIIANFTTCERAILLKISESSLSDIQQNNLQLWYKLFDLICKSFVALQRAAEKLDIRLHSEFYNR